MPIPELQQFRDLLAEKSAAKALFLEALGKTIAAKAAGHTDPDAEAVMAKQGLGGVEGEKIKAAQALADKVVAAHPELFAHLEHYANPESHDQLITLVQTLRKAGLFDEATAAAMFELSRFDRKQIGTAPQIGMRPVGGKT